jgi:hypothetical protein
MHIAMVRTDDPTRKKINLLLTDLPGEWSDTLIDRAETANRFNFLRRADGIIIMIDGPILAAPSTRHVEIQKMTVLLGRLGNNIHVDLDIPMVLLLTKADEIDMVPPPGLKTIEHAARDLGFSPVTIMSIAFSRKPKNFTSGVGIIETIDAIIDIDYPISVDRVERQFSNDARSFTSFRHLELKEG